MGYVSRRKQPGTRDEKIKVEGKEFEFVTNQRDYQSAIYRSPEAYLRIGKPERIQKDLAFHRTMEEAGFPVAKVLAEGERDGEAYFIETSLGDTHFGDIFARDIEREGSISEESLEQFISVCELFARAQLGTRSGHTNYDEFAQGILLDTLSKEMPEQAVSLKERFSSVKVATAELPSVITHGDFNPNNIYPTGVIDLENSFHAPYGYDLISAIAHIDSFPDSEEYEYFAKYRFSRAQVEEYMRRMKSVSQDADLKPLSETRGDFEFCRAVWLAADIPNVPKLQSFRFEYVIKHFL
jgi:hypothetical protein